ncbi:transposase [Thermodesulfobacteriota bacterium]
MRPQQQIPEEARCSLRTLLKNSVHKAEFQRIQCVLLRADLGLTAAQTAQAVGLSEPTVKRIWSRYRNDGEQALTLKKRGGRRHYNLTPSEEDELLEPFFKTIAAGQVPKVSELKKNYEIKLGRTVSKSTVYRMLSRHGWNPSHGI